MGERACERERETWVMTWHVDPRKDHFIVLPMSALHAKLDTSFQMST